MFRCHVNRDVRLPLLGKDKKLIPENQQDEIAKKKLHVRRVWAFDVSRAVRLARFESVCESQVASHDRNH